MSSNKENLLKEIIDRNRGLLRVCPKVDCNDKYLLSLIDKPGVEVCCEKLKAQVNEVAEFTNKGNSMLIISDGSGMNNQKGKENIQIYPYLESLCVIYKEVYNIDAYPLVLDVALISKIDEIVEIVYNLTSSYAGFELFGFDLIRLDKIIDLTQREYIVGLIVGTHARNMIKEALSKYKDAEFYTSILMGAMIRAGLDLNIIHPLLDIDLKIFIELALKEIDFDKTPIIDIALKSVELAARALISQEIVKIKIYTPEQVKKRLEKFYFFGEGGWLNEENYDYTHKEKGISQNTQKLHLTHRGVIEAGSHLAIRDLSLLKNIFTLENVKEISDLIAKDPNLKLDLTCIGNTIAIITNGSALQAFGKLGSDPALPMIEGSCLLLNKLVRIDAIPFCLRDGTADKMVKHILDIAKGFSGIQISNVKSPECFDIEKNLSDRLDIPVYGDDHDGTAIIVYAGLLNALKLAKKELTDVKIIINGSGASGIGIARLLIEEKVSNIILCDTHGVIYVGRDVNMNKYKEEIAHKTNKMDIRGTLKDALKEADVFIGVSVPGCLNPEWIKEMNPNPIIFALANPDPEIWPSEAKAAGAFIYASGRPDMKNQLTNVLVYPGLFRGLIEIRAKKITMSMKIGAARAIASLISEVELNPEKIIPDALDVNVPLAVARIIILMGRREGVGKKPLDLEESGSELYYHTIHGRFLERKFMGNNERIEEKEIEPKVPNP